MRRDPADPGPRSRARTRCWLRARVVAFVLALVITLAVPATGYWPLLLLVLADPVVQPPGSGSAEAGPATTRVGE